MADVTLTISQQYVGFANVRAGLCACGCGHLLEPNGPSPWYASESCQLRWHQQHAARQVPGRVA